MAVLASKSPYPAPLGVASNQGATYRPQATSARANNGTQASPTDSEFSESYEDKENVRSWDERKVDDWLRSINCAQYIQIFRANHINGENLMDMDQGILREIGVQKIGDRIRLCAQAKLFRHKEFRRKRGHNADPFAALENPAHTPPSSASPRQLQSTRPRPTSRAEKRLSRQMGSDYGGSGLYTAVRPSSTSRPNSPLYADGRQPKFANLTAVETHNIEQGGKSAIDTPPTARFSDFPKSTRSPNDSPQNARFGHSVSSSLDNSATNTGPLSQDKALIRVIFDDGRSSVVGIEGCKTSEEIILRTLKKGNLRETLVKSYCFYVLDGTDPNPAYCRRLTDAELFRVCLDRSRQERERLIFRKIHTGEPEEEQLVTAASIAAQQPPPGPPNPNTRSQLKIQQLTGESLAPVSYPMSPTSLAEREMHLSSAAQDLERPEGITPPIPMRRQRKEKGFNGGRPPSELVVADPTTYFPDVEKDKIERLNRMSIRRSQRLSRATSRLSTASNFSIASLKDAPPIPTIADSWLNAVNQPARLRPLSILRMQRPTSTYRDSVASTLEPLDEESPFEPNRKSYVSFGAESGIDPGFTDPENATVQQGYFDYRVNSPGSGENSGSLNEQLSQAIAEDGEDPDEELTEYLQPESWDNVKYIRGKLIGQGSFGSVYLALHAITGELMAVKQVEMPSTSGTPLDAKKNNMVEALKREIALLRELKHPSIVQYLGSSSDANTLNIFLEYIPGGSISKMLVDYGQLNENLVANFVRQILVGLAYLHSKDIIHRDIKGANILVDNHGAVKISDFGISKRVEASQNLLLPTGGSAMSAAQKKAAATANRVSLQGSVFWMAPEVVKQTAYTRKADIWSLGCLIVEMLTGSHPHPNCTQLQAIFKIGGSGDASPDIPDFASRDAKAFLKRTFEVEHEKRPEAEELLQSPWLAVRESGAI